MVNVNFMVIKMMCEDVDMDCDGDQRQDIVNRVMNSPIPYQARCLLVI
jgi:hypothetical protein